MDRPLKIYSHKNKWKWLLFFSGIIIVITSVFFSNRLVMKIEKEERNKVHLWADAIHKKASLVKYTKDLFSRLQSEERKKVELLAEAHQRLALANNNVDLTFYLKIISGNQTIPVVVVNNKNKITTAVNVSFDIDSVKYFNEKLRADFSVYPPIKFNYSDKYSIYLYYKDSHFFTELKNMMADQIQSFISEVVVNSASSPVIITDESKSKIITYGNLDSTTIQNPEKLKETLSLMASQNTPIEIELEENTKSYIYYKDSKLLIQLRYFPYIQIFVIGAFIILAYILFSLSRNAEQNQVWMGMAKETAHQLGTPLSSLFAWTELLKLKGVDNKMVNEIENDVKRLEIITERFSKIGSPPQLIINDIEEILQSSISYLIPRTPKNIKFDLQVNKNNNNDALFIPLNVPLFQWVIENMCRNAIDAMGAKGSIDICVKEEEKIVFIDISDTGKGIPKSKHKRIFQPGYTTKKTGWGLGLSLSKRIITNYHSGKIFVKESILNKGTTFRIILKRSQKNR